MLDVLFIVTLNRKLLNTQPQTLTWNPDKLSDEATRTPPLHSLQAYITSSSATPYNSLPLQHRPHLLSRACTPHARIRAFAVPAACRLICTA